MSLAAALEAEAARKPGPRCTLCLVLDRLPESEAEALAAALAGDTMASAGISRALIREGHNIAAVTVRRHRAGECAGL